MMRERMVASNAHDLNGSRISKTLENGFVTSYSLDMGSFLTEVSHLRSAAFAPSTPDVRPSTVQSNRFLFTDRATSWLPEDGIYDYRNRVYSPELGRFLQTDPIRFEAGDVNLYRYVGNNPMNWIDPDGLQGGRSRPCCRGVPYNRNTQCCASGVIVDKIKRHEKLGLSLGECVGRFTLDPFESMALGGFSIGIGFKNPWVGAAVGALILLDQAEATSHCLGLVCP